MLANIQYHNSSFLGSDVATVVVMKSSISWDIMLCSPLEVG
jgi:hypothetical protein